MGFLDTTKKSLASNLNFKQWMGFNNLKQSTNAIYGMYKDLKPKQTNSKTDPQGQLQSFEELMAQNGITEQELNRRTRNSFRAFIVYLLCLIVVTIYSLFLLLGKHYETALFNGVLVLVFISFTFREHFNYFQMKEHRLGCTFKDWLSALFRGNTQ